jgi:outer membrane protein TolC
MAQALQAAWPRSPEAAQAGGRQQRAQAEQAVASNWLAAAPALELSQREGRSAANAGSRETEVGVALPLWRLGLREQAGRAAQAEADWAQAAGQAARLRLAGQLRETAGQLRAAEAEVQQAELQQRLLATLAEDVARRVRAGDLAPADALAARAELLAAQAQASAAQQRLRGARAQWQLLTGLAPAPEPEAPVADSAADPAAHPVLQAAQLELERSRQRVARVQAQGGAAPEVKFSVRQEQAAQDQGERHSVALGLRLPLASGSYRQPELAAALAEQDLAEASLQRSRQQTETERLVAQDRVQASAAQAAAEAERAQLLRERARLLERSFKAGETPLPELLRTYAAAAQAEATAARLQAAQDLAQAQLRQALGMLP